MTSLEETVNNSIIYRKLGIYLIISVFSALLNITALIAVFKKKKNSSYFIINIFLASLTTQVIGTIVLLNWLSVIELSGYWRCGLYNVVRRVATGIMPLTVAGLYYERLKTPELRSGNFKMKKVFCMTWAIALLISFPTFFTVENFSPDDGGKPYCKKKPLMNSVVIKIIYEGSICLLLHIFPSIFIFYYLFKIKFRVEYLLIHEHFPTALKKKLQRIRLMFWYSVSFVVFWMPFGLIYFIGVSLEDPRKKTTVSLPKDSNLPFVYLLFTMVLILHPTIYLWVHNKLLLKDLIKIFSCFKQRYRQTEIPIFIRCRCITSAGKLTVEKLSLDFRIVQEQDNNQVEDSTCYF